MGRWAQAKRSGGGHAAAPTELLQMILAVQEDADTASVQYSGPVTAAAFNPIDFESQPSFETGIAVGQLAADTLEIDFSGTITGDTDLLFNGTVPGILSPDSKDYS